MSFSGNLEDVSVVDLLQFIRIGGRTGTLILTSGIDRAELGFHGGRIASATGPGTLRLGELLLAAGAIDLPTLDAALAHQAATSPHRTLGRILSDGGLAPEAMYLAVRRQIQDVVQQVVGWKQGAFEFAPEELKLMGDLASQPGEMVSAVELDTQSALLEALQILDESRRDAPPEPLPPPPPRVIEQASQPAAPAGRPRVQIVSRDLKLIESLSAALEGEGVQVARAALHEAGTSGPGEPPPVVLLDLRQAAIAVEAIAGVRRTRRRALVMAVVDSGVPVESTYRAGALVALPGDVDLWTTYLKTLLSSRDEQVPESPRLGMARLRRVFGDMRSGLLSTSISLSLMNVLAESVERCVLFLARGEFLVSLGAFGAGPGGRSLGQVTSGMRFDKGASPLLSACVEDGEARVGAVDDGTMPASFFARIAKPRTGQFAIFPVVGGQRVIALVYVDNGVSSRAIDDMDILELASAQAGLALENELLRREASRRS
jgi:hypothetical protein